MVATKVFVSWSGEQSMALAEELSRWLPKVIQAVKPYYSPVDIEKGKRWNADITKELSECQVGLLCVTSGNGNAPWLMFEAGALSKSVIESRVIPLPFGTTAANITYPLAQFQAAPFSKAEMRKVLETINRATPDSHLTADLLSEQFEMWWPHLEVAVERILSQDTSESSPPTDSEATRTDRELLEPVMNFMSAYTGGHEHET